MNSPIINAHTSEPTPADNRDWRKMALFWFLLALVICVAYTVPVPENPAPQLSLPLALKPQKTFDFQADFSKAPLEKSELLPQPCKAAHAASQLLLPNGRLLVVYFAGSRECGRDVAIYLTAKDPLAEIWSEPQKIITAEKLTRDTMAMVNKIGNPVLFYDGTQQLHLFVVGALGGWSTSSIYHVMSNDEGRSWARAKRLEMTPFLLFSNLIRGEPLALEEDALLLPTYHEFLVKYPEVAVVSLSGKVVYKTYIDMPVSAIQPALLALDSRQIFAFCRNTSMQPSSKAVVASSGNGGASWYAGPPLEINNEDTGLAVLRFADDAWMLIGKPDKERLVLYLSRDHGITWTPWFDFGAVNENEGQSISYPSIVRMSSNQVSITYSRNKTDICRTVLTLH